MKKFLRPLIYILILAGATWVLNENAGIFKNTRVDAAGDVTFTFPGSPGDPLFSFTNIAPGFSDSQSVTANNGDTVSRQIGVKAIKTGGTGGLENALDVVISESGTDLYGGSAGAKTLADFLSESASINGVKLSTLSAGESKSYDITVTFKTEAGDQFQNTSVIFDLRFGIITDVPVACEEMRFSANSPIFGTAGNDTIQGTPGNDLIFALEGDDTVNGMLGHDCIIGALGNDRLTGGVGRDVLVGNEGEDRLLGGADNDQLLGGDGNDDVRGEQGRDVLFGDAGNDTMLGGAENDTLWGGEGNDTLNGQEGSDTASGEEGNDTMVGADGNDMLLGGVDTDSANGNAGRDTCQAEVRVLCEIIAP